MFLMAKKLAKFDLVKKHSPKILFGLASIFFVIWIIIGIFALIIISQSLNAGLLTKQGGNESSAQNVQVPKETDLPGIGRVNIECTQNALKPESIQNLVQSGDISVLSKEEKAAFEPCIVS